MKILIANPPWREGGLFGLRPGCRFPYLTDELTWEGVPTYMPFPFSLAMAAALLKKNGFAVEFWDGVAEGAERDAFLERIVGYRPDLYIQETVAPSYSYDGTFFRDLRKRLPECVLGVAGSLTTAYGHEMFEENDAFDVGLTYEWEETSLELAQRLAQKASLDGVKGLIHRRGNEIRFEERRPSPDLKMLPWSLRDSLPMLRYNDDFAFLPVPNLQLFSSRGCPYSCSFCVWITARYGNSRVRFRDPEDIMDEIAHCLQRWPIKAFYFDDDTFNISKEYTLEICAAIKRRKFGIPWAAMCRADLFDRETLEACRDAGLIAVKYGVESADQGILDGIRKGLVIERAEENIALTRNLGIHVHLTLIVGLPGETEKTLRKTWRFVKRVRPDYLQFALATPYPGTPLYEQAVKHGWIEAKNWNEFNADSRAAMRTEALSRPELERWMRRFNALRFGLQLVGNPWKCLQVYARKALQSPRKLFNAGASLLGLNR